MFHFLEFAFESSTIKSHLILTESKRTLLKGNVWRNKLSLQVTKSSSYAHFWNTHLNRCEVVMCGIAEQEMYVWIQNVNLEFDRRNVLSLCDSLQCMQLFVKHLCKWCRIKIVLLVLIYYIKQLLVLVSFFGTQSINDIPLWKIHNKR